MQPSRLVLILTGITAGIMFLEGRYFLHWLTVLAFGVTLAIILFGMELGLPAVGLFREENRGEKRNEVKALAKIIKRAEKGKTARSIIEERIIEAYASASDNYNETFSSLRSNPNEALRALRRGGNFMENLEEALRIMEDDMNED
ncbi:hypothetical protein [Thermococcus sp. Bubb.Bath]|uniref:hypothetical protein n=1 Tax=Thermococcus sp. Bubb.Bath TaxID=1638242 RepID=UPI00143AE999|nr:hypothetical protein [Thermococcus sp. Bubb.Bath]NJF25837.1 hypothetical protein [Thermococcus sp. Bubb.Bath]